MAFAISFCPSSESNLSPSIGFEMKPISIKTRAIYAL